MIYRTICLFSKKEEYINGKETDHQKNDRKRIAGAIAGTGLLLGNKIGSIESGSKNRKRAEKIVNDSIKDVEKTLDLQEKMKDVLKKNGGHFKDQQTEDNFRKIVEWSENRINANKGVLIKL